MEDQNLLIQSLIDECSDAFKAYEKAKKDICDSQKAAGLQVYVDAAVPQHGRRKSDA